MKLHLGCGNRFLPGFVHVDIDSDFPDAVRCDLRALPFADESVDEIYVCHALEHFGRAEVWNVLREWRRVLKLNGLLRIAVPDFEAICALYSANGNLLPLLGLLYGGQDNVYDFHKLTFDFCVLSRVLESVGFTDVKRYDVDTFLTRDQDDYSKAYLTDPSTKTRTLMSLNVVCTKCETASEDEAVFQAVVGRKLYQRIKK
jgi:predicted SAM-dependent methyltransferase